LAVTQRADDKTSGVRGRVFVPTMLALAVVTVAVAFAFIRPEPGFEPAAEGDRPFGPATSGEIRSRPLIEKGGRLPTSPPQEPARE
jgi:hypothetical protein